MHRGAVARLAPGVVRAAGVVVGAGVAGPVRTPWAPEGRAAEQLAKEVASACSGSDGEAAARGRRCCAWCGSSGDRRQVGAVVLR